MHGKKERNSDGIYNEVLSFFFFLISPEKSKTTQVEDTRTGNPPVLAILFSHLLAVMRKMG